MAHIIGITGLSGAGKDTCAQAMATAYREFGVRAALEGYADPIRKIAYNMGLNPFDRKTKEVDVTMLVDRFCDLLQWAIDLALRNRLSSEEQALLYRYTLEALKVGEAAEITISPHRLMQVLGTEGGQRIRRTLWVEMAASRWARYPGYVLVTDFRFEHELEPLNEIICVYRKDWKRINDHVSEDLADNLTRNLTRYIDGKPVFYMQNIRSLKSFEQRCAQYATQTHNLRNSA